MALWVGVRTLGGRRCSGRRVGWRLRGGGWKLRWRSGRAQSLRGCGEGRSLSERVMLVRVG